MWGAGALGCVQLGWLQALQLSLGDSDCPRP